MVRKTKLNAGLMRHKITIQVENSTTDAGGGQTDPWASPIKLFDVMASITPFSGRENLHGMQLEGKITHRIRTRWRSGVTEKHRVLFGTRVFNIRNVINVEERSRVLELLVEEGVAF